MSRTKNTLRNIRAGTVNKVITLILPFVARTILIKMLGSEYAGLSSLFVSILQVLNLAELGVGTAITFSLYKPAADEDIVTVRATMNLYKKIYRLIGFTVLVIGLILMPFLSHMINGEIPSGINLYILYLIYLINAVLTYFLFAYKTILLEVHQKNNIISNIGTGLYIVQFIFQMIVLVCFKNYYLYIGIMPFITIANNIIGAIYAKKLYPQYYCEGKLPKTARREIRKRVYGLMLQKLCATTRNSLDSIFISALLGLNMVAIYNNYYMIASAITGFLSVIVAAMTASVGNSVATETKKKNYGNMMTIDFLYMLISGVCTVCLVCLYQPFMEGWLGSESLLSLSSVMLISLYFYVLKMGDIRSVYMQGAGLWWEGRYRAVAESGLNLVLNFVLGSLFGVNGIIASTIISLLLINFAYGASIIYRYYFVNEKFSLYIRRHLLYFAVTLFVSSVSYLIVNLINISGFIGLAIKGVICLFLSTMLYYLIYRNYHMFKKAKDDILCPIIATRFKK